MRRISAYKKTEHKSLSTVLPIHKNQHQSYLVVLQEEEKQQESLVVKGKVPLGVRQVRVVGVVLVREQLTEASEEDDKVFWSMQVSHIVKEHVARRRNDTCSIHKKTREDHQ